MANQEIFIKKYYLSDFFDLTVKMLPHIWKNALLILSLVFIPLSFFFWFCLKQAFSVLPSVINMAAQNPDLSAVLENMSRFYGYIGLLVLITGVASLFAKGVISLNTFKAAFGQPAPLSSLTGAVFKKKLLKLILLSLLITMIYVGIIITAILVTVLGSLLFSALMQNVILAVLLAIGFYLGLFTVIIWLSVKFSFALEAIILDDCPVFTSISTSFKLVQKNWWRVFGITLLINLIISFMISIIIAPVSMFIMLPEYFELIKTMLNNGNNELPGRMLEFYTKYIPVLGISFALQSIITYMLFPVFKALFYIDLKVRHNQLDPPPPPVNKTLPPSSSAVSL